MQPLGALCNMVNIIPVGSNTSNTVAENQESMMILRTGKHTAQEKGKAPIIEEPEPEIMPSLPQDVGVSRKVEYDVIAHLRRLPARLSIYDALQLSREAREALINALMDEAVRDMYLAEIDGAVECNQTITFTDEDLLLGNADHNRPLFVSGNLAGEHINCILLDAGSAVNRLSLKTR